MNSPDIHIRAARNEDTPEIIRLIRALAKYEELEHACESDAGLLEQHLFGERAYAEALVAESSDRVVGFALFFHNYSTFRTKPGIHLEDLFVEPEHRRRGIGRALLRRVIDLAAERDCGRVEWMVLDWNEPALEFYRSAFGAEALGEWVLNRVNLAPEKLGEHSK